MEAFHFSLSEDLDMLRLSINESASFQAHLEDITVGLTLLSLRYEGLRMSDFEAGILRKSMWQYINAWFQMSSTASMHAWQERAL